MSRLLQYHFESSLRCRCLTTEHDHMYTRSIGGSVCIFSYQNTTPQTGLLAEDTEMVKPSSRSNLAIADIGFCSPAFLVSVAICFKQGFSKNPEWLYVILISVFRLIGASCILLYLFTHTQQDYSSGILKTAAITSSIGTAPLMLGLLGFLQRIDCDMVTKTLSLNFFRPIHPIALVALTLALVGGIYRSQPDGNNHDTGKD